MDCEGYELSVDIARDILQRAFHAFDATIGINLDVIAAALDFYRDEIMADIEVWRVGRTCSEELPLLVGKLESEEGRGALEKRMKDDSGQH